MKTLLSFHGLTFRLDCGDYRLASLKKKAERSGVLHFLHEDLEVFLAGAPVPHAPFQHWTLRLRFHRKAVLQRISWKVDAAAWPSTFLYQTFFNASAALFQRRGRTGRCLGFANPFCQYSGDELFFEPSIRFDCGEEYECDDVFIGDYPLTGQLVSPEFGISQMDYNGRFHPRYRNPGEGIALDYGEIHAFNRYTAWYCQAATRRFQSTSYNFFSNLPQRPDAQESIGAYKAHIDACKLLGLDAIILNPLCQNRVPDENPRSFWEFFPSGSTAEAIFLHARQQGLKIGIYSGTAGTGALGDSPMIPFADVANWKKHDCQGHVSSENCLGSEEFMKWFIQVQANTIRKYSLDIWNWDPGPGNAMFCFNPAHRHLPGKGAYLGFRNSLRVMAELKKQFPNLYYQGFHGNKEYGVWGFKYVDQHEAFWENEVYTMMPIFPDLSADRCTADGIRQQSAWNYLFRFLPATLNHGLAHRMVQACWQNLCDNDRLVDENGWKYALLSAIAAGGPVTLPILPHDMEKRREYRQLFKKWLSFARKNFKYGEWTIPFGAFPGCGIDGFAKIRNNRGFLFLFNATPHPESLGVSFNQTLGFSGSGTAVYLKQIYPCAAPTIQAHCGKQHTFALQPYGVKIYRVVTKKPAKLVRAPKGMTPPLPRTLRHEITAAGQARAVFQAPKAIQRLLTKAADSLDSDVSGVISRYLTVAERCNDVWARPDRLWLWVAFDTPRPELVSLCLNGKKISFRQETYNFLNLSAKGLYFADITDIAQYGQENALEAEYAKDSGNIIFYLHYPRSAREAEPDDATLLAMQKRLPWKIHSQKAPCLSMDVKIVSARLNQDNIMRQKQENELVATVNLPPEQLEGVYASVPISIGRTGNHLKHDMALEWRDGAWRCTFLSGERLALIIDDEKLVLWAVTRAQTESAGYSLPIQWEL